MSTGQRIILMTCGLLLAVYLTFLGFNATSTLIDASGNTETSIGGETAGAASEDNFNAPGQLEAAGIALEPYRHGVMTTDGGNIRIARNGEDGFGIFFKPKNLTGTLVIPFSATGDARVIVRTTVRGERAYRNAAPGDFMRITPETEEVLIFTEVSGFIDITIQALVDCATDWDSLCADSNYLANKIGIGPQISTNPEEELLLILDWVANNLVWSSDRSFTEEGNELVKKYSAAQMYASAYEPEKASGYCGASAIFLAKVLNELGYSAITINIGTGPNLSHVTTLVFDPFDDGQFYMMDPTFNAIFVAEGSGEWASMADILSGETENIRLMSRPVEGRRFMTNREFSSMTDCRPAKGRLDVQICSRPGYGFDDYIRSFGNAFDEAGMTADEKGYMSLLRQTYFSVGDQAAGNVRERYLALLQANGVRVEK